MTCRCRNIVVVETNDLIRESIQDFLESEGYSVLVAATQKHGLEMLGRIEHPCLILIDLLDPGMRGWDFLNVRRRNDVLAQIPVAVMSSNPRPEEPKKAEIAGAEGYIQKPFDLDSLRTLVKKFCGNADRPNEAAAP